MQTSLGVKTYEAHRHNDYNLILINWLANQHLGGDGSMDIKTGVFTVLTSGYYTITFRWVGKTILIASYS